MKKSFSGTESERKFPVLLSSFSSKLPPLSSLPWTIGHSLLPGQLYIVRPSAVWSASIKRSPAMPSVSVSGFTDIDRSWYCTVTLSSVNTISTSFSEAGSAKLRV